MRVCLLSALLMTVVGIQVRAEEDPFAQGFEALQPLLKEYCLTCHSTKEKSGELDLERFGSLSQLRQDLKPWQAVIVQLEAGEMPPKDQPQPTAAQKQQLLDWTRSLLESEARKRAGDPGRVPLRRLSNTEYNHTVRDLTGYDLQPAREFPADGAAGEGFTNAAEALSMSPALMTKYMNAARDIAAHAVLLPKGFRFSPSKTRRDWTDESVAELRRFYHQFTPDGNLPLRLYLSALVRHREALRSGTVTLETLSVQEKLNSRYLKILWQSLTGTEPSYPLDRIRARWETATETEVDALVAEVNSWRDKLWTFGNIGSYRHEARAMPKQPPVVETVSLPVNLTPAPGQREVELYLVARELGKEPGEGHVVWSQPRFEGNNLPSLALKDYPQFGARYEVDYSTLFAPTEKYLTAAIEAAETPDADIKQLAGKHGLDEVWLKRWLAVLDLKRGAESEPGRAVAVAPWQLLNEQSPNPQFPAVKGWKARGAELPVLLTNASEQTEQIPGRITPHSVAVHPMPGEFVAVIWKSPLEGQVQVTGKVLHAHPACGNGVAWWLEKQSPARAAILAEGRVDLGKEAEVPAQQLRVVPGDLIFLGIDARDANHVCDLTEIALTVTELEAEKPRVWNLAADIADNVLAGNPHADGLGNPGVWSFVKGLAKDRPIGEAGAVDTNSLLARWRRVALEHEKRAQADQLAKELRTLLTGPRPAEESNPQRVLYDNLLATSGPLLQGMDLTRLGKPAERPGYGLPAERFGRHQGQPSQENSLVTPVGEVIKIRLPAELFRERRFAVEGKLDADSGERIVQFQVLSSPPAPGTVWDGATAIVTAAGGAGQRRFLDGLARYRELFPPYLCYPHIIPVDEVVCLKTFHREDEPLIRLFMDEQQVRQLDDLWQQHRFITKSPVVEDEYLPLFIGFVTQDQPKETLDFFEGQRPAFRQRAEEFEREFDAAAPAQLEQLLDFASRAWRRPLANGEVAGLKSLYQSLRQKDVPHEEAFRSVLARVLISPAFLLHLELAPEGAEAKPVNDWELASRLSYFLWGTMPDEELRTLAAEGKLHQPETLAAQTRRLLKDDRIRALAIEFGTQWIHVRGFDQFQEKNEKLFPTFNEPLRRVIYEESILFFQHLFQQDRPISEILNADYTFLNEQLAQHYGIPNVAGDDWRKVDGVKQYGRGGILGLASVQSRQAGASRTSPVLRGNWVVETLLAEKLPKPPPGVPQLPEVETGNDGLTMRQVVEKHVRDRKCAVCHERIDPFGFALENYDAIGRLRATDPGGLELDSRVKLRDGTQFTGIEGLRRYLLTQKKDIFERSFYRRLLGYALARSVTISDQPLIDEITAKSAANEGRLSTAVLLIVQSPQFRMIRGSEYADPH